MSFQLGGAGTGKSNSEDNMNNIAEMIRTDPSMRQTFIDIAAQQNPALGQQLTQSLRLLDLATRTAGSATTLSREEKEVIQRLTERGVDQKRALVAYLASNKNEAQAANYIVNDKSLDSKGAKTLAIRQLISDNPAFKQGLNDFIAQNDPALSQQIKANLEILQEGLQPESGGDDTGLNYLSIDRDRRVVETLPLSARTHKHTNSASFYVIKLPTLADNISHLRHLVVEFCIQPNGDVARQAIWWTSYVLISRRGALSRGTGVYTEWDEFGEVSSHQPIGIIAPRSGFRIADISKGVLNGNHTNGTVLRVVDLKNMERNVEIFAVLVASGMHSGAYQAHGQVTLEYSL